MGCEEQSVRQRCDRARTKRSQSCRLGEPEDDVLRALRQRHRKVASEKLQAHSRQDPQDTSDVGRLRNFESTKKGRIVNRGDSSRYCWRDVSWRSYRTKPEYAPDRRFSLQAPLQLRDQPACDLDRGDVNMSRVRVMETADDLRRGSTTSAASSAVQSDQRAHSVLILGAPEVGKSSVARQFQTSEYTNGSEHWPGTETDPVLVSVCLDADVTELAVWESTFRLLETPDEEALSDVQVFVVMFSVDSPESFAIARALCQFVRDHVQLKPIILVANKCDLVRKRKVTNKDGRVQALEYGCKYVETSVVINANVDELLAGVVAQCRIYSSCSAAWTSSPHAHSHKSRSFFFRDIVYRIIAKRNELKSCQNLHVR